MAIDALAALPELFSAGAGAAEAGAGAAALAPEVGAGLGAAEAGAGAATGGLGAIDAAAGAGAGLGASGGLGADFGALGSGLGSIGAGVGGGAGAGAAGLADITGTGAGLFGGATGLEGTALGTGAAAGDTAGLFGTGAATAAGSAADFMGAPGASAFSPGAMSGDASAFGSIPGASSAPGSSGFPTFNQDGTMMGNLTSAQGQVPAAPGSSVFSTGTAPLTGSPGAASSGASPFAAPSGVTSPGAGTFDPTSAAATSGATTGDASAATTPAAAASPMGKTAGSGILSTLKDYSGLAGVGLAGAGLANNLINKNNVPGQAQVNAINSTIPQLQGLISNVNQQANKLANSTGSLDANTLQMLSYVNNGQLPPAFQSQVDNGVAAAKAAATSAMAARGMPSDPASNPQLASQLATIDNQALEMKAQIENQLYQSGLQAWQASNQTQQVAGQLQTNALSATGLDLQTYMGLQNIYQNQSNQEQAAIGNLTQALGRMGTGSGNNTLTIKSG